jgi:hypothetical protein
MPSIKLLLAPITVRFFATDGLIETMQFLDMCDRTKLDTDLAKFADRTQLILAKELIRRKVRFWEQI